MAKNKIDVSDTKTAKTVETAKADKIESNAKTFNFVDAMKSNKKVLSGIGKKSIIASADMATVYAENCKSSDTARTFYSFENDQKIAILFVICINKQTCSDVVFKLLNEPKPQKIKASEKPLIHNDINQRYREKYNDFNNLKALQVNHAIVVYDKKTKKTKIDVYKKPMAEKHFHEIVSK